MATMKQLHRNGPHGSRRRRALGVAAAATAASLLVVACSGSKDSEGSSTSAPGGTGTSAGTTPGSLLPKPPDEIPPLLDPQKVDGAVGQLGSIVGHAMDETGVPGVAVAVVYQDKVIFKKGYGVREVGKTDKIDENTVFQLASVSKPLASTIVAGVVGDKTIKWDDPVSKYNPGFKFKDPYVTENATFADLMSHRSGMYTGSGDLLEDLGWDRDYILAHLDQQPLDSFRAGYHYSNFGYTEGGESAAVATKTSWADLADTVLFKPLGMNDTSYRHEDYVKRADKASIHVLDGDISGKRWVAKYQRDADAEAPAGGASSSVADLAQWIRLQLGNGKYDGKQIIDEQALVETHIPHQELGPPPAPDARTQFYGLGWNTYYDDQARLKIDHSGAFARGAATNVAMLPSEGLGIVVLTNGMPYGIPEAIASSFLDVAQNGRLTVDWIKYRENQFSQLYTENKPPVDYSKAPASARPAQADDSYTGTYANSYYGPLTVSAEGGKLSMSMGPTGKPTTFALTHFDGDTFSFETIGENSSGLAGAIFKAADGKAASVVLDFYDQTGLGTFTRS